MAYVSVIWEGAHPQNILTDPPRDVPVADCIGRLRLNRDHYFSPGPPKIPSDNPKLDGFRDPHGVAVNLKGDDAPQGWRPGWYVVPAKDLPLREARTVLAQYPAIDPGDY